jgi:hypothetical protein
MGPDFIIRIAPDREYQLKPMQGSCPLRGGVGSEWAKSLALHRSPQPSPQRGEGVTGPFTKGVGKKHAVSALKESVRDSVRREDPKKLDEPNTS